MVFPSFVVGKIKLSALEIDIIKGFMQSSIYGKIYLVQYFLTKGENGMNHLANENKTFKTLSIFFLEYIIIVLLYYSGD